MKVESKLLDDVSMIADAFADLRTTFSNFSNLGDVHNNETLIEFEHRFNDLRAEMIPVRSRLAGLWTAYESTGVMRNTLAYKIQQSSEKKMNITEAERIAGGSDEYREFRATRKAIKEMKTTIDDMFELCQNFVNEIKDRLK